MVGTYTKNIHVIGVDPGGTTGWCRVTVPRASIFDRARSEIVEWDYGELAGPEVSQVFAFTRLVRETQSLDYKIGPAIVCESWDIDPRFKSTDPEALSPARIGAMLLYARECGQMGDAMVGFQSRVLAKTTLTDDRLRAAGMYVAGSAHIRDATRHALTFLRRAKQSQDLREEMWSQD